MKAVKRYPVRKNRRRMLKFGVVAFVVLLVSVPVLNVLFPQPAPPYHPNPNTFYFKAAIVDEESLTYADPAFVQNATTTLQNAGFAVDYIAGPNVTVDFYKNLPTHDYGIIILRVHSGFINGGNPWIALCTCENYSAQKYVVEQLDNELLDMKLMSTGENVFALGPNFKMNGHFENTIIIMMGCYGFGMSNGPTIYMGLAEMFVRNGAKAYIGFSSGVTASGSDNAVQQLLQNLLVKRETLGNAVASAPSDPVTGALLAEYPHGIEMNFVIPQESPQNNQTSGTTGMTAIYVKDTLLRDPKSPFKIITRFS
jgi:hypothetical protein